MSSAVTEPTLLRANGPSPTGSRLWPRGVIAALVLIISSCSTSAATDQGADATTGGQVEAAWQGAARCLAELGYDANVQRHDGLWSVAIDGLSDDAVDSPQALELDRAYDTCTKDAERITREFDRSQVPDGTERLELAKSLERCLAEVGISTPVYDPNDPNESDTNAAIFTALGYSQDDVRIFDDPRFEQAMSCVNSHRYLFPDAFAEAPGGGQP